MPNVIDRAAPIRGLGSPLRAARPRPIAMSGVNGNGKKDLGLAILAAISVAGVHSAIAPSWFTFRAFASKPEARGPAMQTLYISLAASTVTAAGIYLVFDQLVPALVAEVVGLGLFGLGVLAVHSEPILTIPPIQQQPLARVIPGGLSTSR